MASTEEALAALEQGQLTDARDLLIAVVQVAPADARSWKVLADVYRQLEDWESALQALDQVRRNTRGGSEAITAWSLTARVCDQRLRRLDRARDAWERVLQIDDSTASAWLGLAELHLRSFKWSAAIGNAEHGLQFANATPRERAWMYLCVSLGKRNISSSTGPTSTFFNRLGNRSNGDRSLVQAFTAWPRLIEVVGHDPLAHSHQTIEGLRDKIPWPEPPPWWGR